MATNEQLNTIIGEIASRTGNNRALDEVVVEEAADVNHPLHGEFDWDDAVAGPKWRREQAKRLIKLARITIADPVTSVAITVPAFIRNPLEPPGSYIPMVRLRDERDVAIEVIRREFERIHSAMRRAEKVAAVIPDVLPLLAIERERIVHLMRRLAGTP